jgi:glycosyltransferase involved in cell wall biosynthesis
VAIVPSLQDNLPNTVLEAMACGTPVIGFDIGGIPDMVKHGITGILTEPENVAGLREGILELLRHPDKRAAMAAACRQSVLEEYTLETQARRYQQLYTTIIESWPHKKAG